MQMDYLLRGLRNPNKAVAKVRRRIGKLQNRVQGFDIMGEDWDVLLILDACRYDMFEKLNDIPGDLQSRRSNGSATREFVQNTFVGETYHDTVYVTANPFVSMDASNVFYATVNLWQTEWDGQLETVRPERVRDSLLRVGEKYPNKRIIGHFIQPHHPFIGPKGREMIAETAGNRAARQRVLGTGSETGGRPNTAWLLAEQGRLDINVLIEAYEENLQTVLPSVRTIVEQLEDKVVVTSDHGNLIDEPAYGLVSRGSRRFSHPKYATATPLVRVPWLVCEGRSRREIRADPPERQEPSEQSVVEDRLQALGYK